MNHLSICDQCSKIHHLLEKLGGVFYIVYAEMKTCGDLKSGDSIYIACENIRFSSLLAAGDISRELTSATQ